MHYFDDNFSMAFDHAMLYEVGGFWDPTDPEVQAGKIETREQRKKVGYVNIPQDRGGVTKYGIAQNANPNVDVRSLTLNDAMRIYEKKYWFGGKCNILEYPLSIIHFDGCVNHGPGRATKFLQRAVGVEEDGVIGKMTLAKIDKQGISNVIQRISEIRSKFYYSLVERDPSQHIFLKGWMRRIHEVTDYTLSKM